MEFTNDEKHRIDVLYSNNFKDVSPEDVTLIQRWEQYKTLADAEIQAKLDAASEEMRAKVEQSKEIAQIAKSNLEELKAAALARLERYDG